MPMPRTSSCPAIDTGHCATTAPSRWVNAVRSSAMRTAPSSIKRSAKSDFPDPEGPRNNTPCSLDRYCCCVNCLHGVQTCDSHRAVSIFRDRQADDKPRSANCAIGLVSILRADRSAMRFDDLFRNGQARVLNGCRTSPLPGARNRTGRKPRPIYLRAIPGPSSITSISISASRRDRCITTRPPGGLKLMAF